MRFVLIASVCLLINHQAIAEPSLVNLKQVQVSPGAKQVDLLFDGKVQANQIRTEFINDVIQLSLMDVGVYPAKISAVNGGDVTKIFAYQYTPRLVRARLTVKGKAEAYRDKVEVVPGGKILTIRFNSSPGASEAVSEKKTQTQDKQVAAHPVSTPERAQPFDPAEDKALLDRVMNGAPSPQMQEPSAAERNADSKRQEKLEKSEKADRSEKKEEKRATKPLGGGKPLPSPFAGLWKLALVLAVFGGIAWACRRWMPSSLKNGLKAMRKKANLVEVISTQSLGPKKSISVVRVSGVTLVLGVTNESINLISRLDGEAGDDLDDASLSQLAIDELSSAGQPKRTESSPEIRITGSGAVSGRAGFSEYLKNATPAPHLTAQPQSESLQIKPGPAISIAPQAPQSDVRNRIRNRLEGLKPL